jgi:predicted dehydrogenase
MAGIGIIGCGNIARKAYVPGCAHYESLNLVGCADVDTDRAVAFAEEHELAFGGSVEDLLARSDIDCVMNLTTPQWHAPVNTQILKAGKHVYLEKPFSLTVAEGLPVLALAEERGLRISCAPDTVLGSGTQHARQLIDAGALGRPHAATLFMAGRGHEHWHPDPAFYYQQGGGPLFDMGPYYLSSLVTLCGPVRRVVALTGQAFSERRITSEPHAGERIPVEVPTHVTALLETVSGVMVTLIMSFDVAAHHLPRIEVHGTEASLSVPDPNRFDGDILLLPWGEKDWQPQEHTRVEQRRAAGAADMMSAIEAGRPHRAHAEMALHIVDIMESIHRAGATGQSLELSTTCAQPAAVPADVALGAI